MTLPDTSVAAARRRPGRHRRRAAVTLIAGVLPLAAAGGALAATGVSIANTDKLVARGPVNTVNGFPAWYQDSRGTRTELCLDDTNPFCAFLPGSVPDPSRPVSFPDNFSPENFYFLAGSQVALPAGGSVTLTTGLEGAFVNAVQNGDQMVFGRVRIVVKGAPVNTALTIRYPYGEAMVDTDATGAGRIVEDIGASAGAFDAALKSNIGPFLLASGGPVTGPDGALYVGNPDVPTTVTGGPRGNTFSVTGPGVAVSNDLFTLQGRIATNHGIAADAAVVEKDGAVDVFATSAGSAAEVVGGAGYATTGMVHDPGSDRFYARVPYSGATPTSIKVRSLSDMPASTSDVPVAVRDVVVSEASYDGTALTVSAHSRAGGELTVKGYGTLTSGTSKSFPTSSPPAAVTVTQGTSSATLPVSVTGGAATVPLAPVPPSSAVDPTPAGEASTSTGGTVTPPTATAPVASVAAADLTLVRGSSTQLDASGSTGAVSYAWSQTSGTAVTITGASTAKPTVALALATTTSATAPASPIDNSPAVLQLVVTGADGTTSTANVTVRPDADSIAITAARHRLRTELRIDGTSLFGSPGAARVLAPATQVLLWGTDARGVRTKLGTWAVDTLGNWSLRLKPGPATQMTSVLVESTRGGSASGPVAP